MEEEDQEQRARLSCLTVLSCRVPVDGRTSCTTTAIVSSPTVATRTPPIRSCLLATSRRKGHTYDFLRLLLAIVIYSSLDCCPIAIQFFSTVVPDSGYGRGLGCDGDRTSRTNRTGEAGTPPPVGWMVRMELKKRLRRSHAVVQFPHGDENTTVSGLLA